MNRILVWLCLAVPLLLGIPTAAAPVWETNWTPVTRGDTDLGIDYRLGRDPAYSGTHKRKDGTETAYTHWLIEVRSRLKDKVGEISVVIPHTNREGKSTEAKLGFTLRPGQSNRSWWEGPTRGETPQFKDIRYR
jgi:hypothetical protein